ncbi:hypothetical protein [Paraburkholderia domus]|uniref:hypothetical protein n=1 Tax=Paraburkholderia domus TaxID=2793075 RepID=UPI001914296F|nr:hypothetical protein [Paraburkholderia domus]MBK5061806.1 hypothetical protein [Burkholderia sp. R-70199]CAE6900856.1 hypothetical protein R70199_03686 [Paraburkholderia domus]
MLIRRIEGATRNLGAPPDWDGDISKCNVLPIRDVVTEQGPFMVSSWEPTPAELAAINAGESIKLWIAGTGHPVVSLSVGAIGDGGKE